MPDQTCSNIIFFEERAKTDRVKPCNNILAIELTIENINVAIVLVNTGSSSGIIFKSTLERMEINLSEITESPIPLVGFSGEAIMTLGSINLPVKSWRITRFVEFLVINRSASYNTIVGTPWLNSMQAIPSTYHMCLKFPSPHRTTTIQGDRKISQVCFAS
ncbi:hypothetical protein N665_0834s0004 [Sinapis alba]|nr:hypothetical protein N665_0834s0004 [Sinapis alba]